MAQKSSQKPSRKPKGVKTPDRKNGKAWKKGLPPEKRLPAKTR